MANAPNPPTPPFIIEAFVYLGIDILVVLFRLFCRTKKGGWRMLAPDDYLMIVAMLPLIAETMIAFMVGTHFHGLTNSNMTDEQRAALSPDTREYELRVGGSKAIIGGWSMYTTLIWMVKASVCAFYLRLTAGLQGYTKRIYIGFGGIVVSYIVCMCSILFSCQPFDRWWQINPAPGNLCEPAVNKLTVYLSMFLNFVTDLYLFMIPIPMIWSVHLPKIKKIGLGVLFSGGIIIMVFGFLRGTAILESDATGPKAGAAWAVRESFVAVTTTNLPMTYGFIRDKLRPFLGSLTSTNKSSKRTGPERGSIMLEDAVPCSRPATFYAASNAQRESRFSRAKASTSRTGSDEEGLTSQDDSLA